MRTPMRGAIWRRTSTRPRPRRLAPGETAPVPTGIALEFPSEYGALVEDRSGLAVRGITTLAGVIDPGYRR